MFASKVDAGGGMPGGGGVGSIGIGLGNPGSNADLLRERKLSSTSSSGGGTMKNKWVKAFKSIKVGKEPTLEPRYDPII
jgi:hypothetical protein